MLPYSSQICSAIDMIIKHISNEFLGSEFQTLKKAFQGSKQLWRWARTRSSHGGKAWRLAAANKNNKYVTSLRRKHFIFCSPNFQGWNTPLYQFGNCLHFRGYYWCIYLKSFQYLNLSMFIFSWKLKGTCCTSVVLKKHYYWYFAFMSNHGCVDISMSSVGLSQCKIINIELAILKLSRCENKRASCVLENFLELHTS